MGRGLTIQFTLKAPSRHPTPTYAGNCGNKGYRVRVRVRVRAWVRVRVRV